MCGIVGMAGNGITTRDQVALKELFQISVIRGHHGTGLFEGRFDESKDAHWFIEKKPYDPNAFLFWLTHNNKKAFDSLFDNVYIGHARYATIGALTERNCHPFHKGDIVGVHNGTLEDSKYWQANVTDSELLYEDISKNGVLPVLKDLSPESAYALVYFDLKTHEINFVRSEPPRSRPLHICISKNRDVIYWASEYEMLEWVLGRNGIEHQEVVTFAPNRLYTLNIHDIDYSKDLVFQTEDYTPRKLTKAEKKAKNKNNTTYLLNYYNNQGVMDSGGVDWDDDIPFESTPPVDIPKIIPKSGKIPHKKCHYCTHEMSLIEQFFSKNFVNSYGETVYECNACEEMNKTITSRMVTEVETTLLN